MKRRTALFLVIWLICLTPVVQAGPQAEYEEAYKIYIAAGASLAAYHNRMGELATRYLEQDGWQIDHYVKQQGRPGARFLIATKDIEPGALACVLRRGSPAAASGDQPGHRCRQKCAGRRHDRQGRVSAHRIGWLSGRLV